MDRAECEKNKNPPDNFRRIHARAMLWQGEVEPIPQYVRIPGRILLNRWSDSVYHSPSCLGGHLVRNRWYFSYFRDRMMRIVLGSNDGWRREKTRIHWYEKILFSGLLLPTFKLFKAVNGQMILDIENRYNYLNLNELLITAKIGDQTFPVIADIAPLHRGSIVIKLNNTKQTDTLRLNLYRSPRFYLSGRSYWNWARILYLKHLLSKN